MRPKALLPLLLLGCVALFGSALGQQEPQDDWSGSRHGGQVAIFQDARVERGEVRRGDVVCVFGDVEIDGEVTHDVVVVGGSLHISGRVGHDVVAVLSTVEIDEGAEIGRNLVNVMGSLENHGTIREDTVNIPVFFRPVHWRTPFGIGSIGSILAWFALLLAILVFFVLLLIAVLVPERVRVLSNEVPLCYPLAFLVGIGGYVAVLVAHALLWITLIGIPISGLLYIAFLCAKWLGVAGICHYIGKGVGRAFGRELSPLAAILIGMLPFWTLHLLPLFLGGIGFLFAFCFRFLYWITVEIPAVGLVILTRGGSRPRARRAPLPSPPVPAPAMPPAP